MDIQETVYQRQCGSKRRMTDPAEADGAARYMSSRYGHPFRGYPCDWCGGWHVGRLRTRAVAIQRDHHQQRSTH